MNPHNRAKPPSAHLVTEEFRVEDPLALVGTTSEPSR